MDGSCAATVTELSGQPGGSAHPAAALGEISPRRAATTGCAMPCCAVPGGVPRLQVPSAPRARPPGPTWARPGAGCGAAGGGRGRAIPYRTVPGRAGPVQRLPPRAPGRPPGRSAWPCGSRCAARPGGTGGAPGRSPRRGRGWAVGSAPSHPGQLRPKSALSQIGSVPPSCWPWGAVGWPWHRAGLLAGPAPSRSRTAVGPLRDFLITDKTTRFYRRSPCPLPCLAPGGCGVPWARWGQREPRATSCTPSRRLGPAAGRLQLIHHGIAWRFQFVFPYPDDP